MILYSNQYLMCEGSFDEWLGFFQLQFVHMSLQTLTSFVPHICLPLSLSAQCFLIDQQSSKNIIPELQNSQYSVNLQTLYDSVNFIYEFMQIQC